jgi:HEAT repeat protein
MKREIDELLEKLADPNGLVRDKARIDLVTLGEEAAPGLTKLLGDKRAQVRWEAANALCTTIYPAAAPALVKCLEDKVFEVRWLSTIALINIGVEGLVPALRAILLTKKPNWLWDGVRHIVTDLAKDDLEETLLPLKEAFHAIDYRLKVPLEARKALHTLEMLPRKPRLVAV